MTLVKTTLCRTGFIRLHFVSLIGCRGPAKIGKSVLDLFVLITSTLQGSFMKSPEEREESYAGRQERERLLDTPGSKRLLTQHSEF